MVGAAPLIEMVRCYVCVVVQGPTISLTDRCIFQRTENIDESSVMDVYVYLMKRDM